MFALLTGVILTSGCNLPEPKEIRNSDGSTFAVTSFEGKVNTRTIHKKTNLPSSSVFNYKACLSDLRQKKPMIGHKFEIIEATQELSTDINGCLTWSETVEYNFLAASKYLKISRTIKGLGPHFGTQTVNFAIDPWSHGNASPKDAIDLSKSSVPAELLLTNKEEVTASLLGKSLSQKKQNLQLWLNMNRLVAVEDRITGKGFEINYDFQATPQIKFNNVNGEQIFHDLTKGQMKGKMQLIHVVLEKGAVQRKVLASKDFSELNIANKIIALGAHFNFEAPYWGHIYLAIQLTPTDDLSELAPFQGLFYLGDYRAISNGGFLLLSSLVQKNPDFTVEQFIAGKYPADIDLEISTKNLPDQKNLPDSARGEKEDFNGKNQMALAALTFSGARIENDSTHRRVLKYQVQACLNHPINHEPIRGQTFEVTPFRTSESLPAKKLSPLVSQMDGCISWPEEFIVEAYDCQKYVKGFVQIKNSDLGIDRKVNVFINPWLTTYEIGVDELRFRDLIGKECKQATNQEKPAYIFINAFQYTLMDIRHDLDSNLNMIIHRDFQMDLDLTLVNNSNLHGGRDGSERLRDGLYLVKTVLTENPDFTQNPRFISANSTIVQSRSGHITLNPASFSFSNSLDMGNRNKLLVQILPVDAEKATLSKDRTTWVPKSGLNMEDVVDTRARLLPMIYESKIILMGEGTRANLLDTKRTLMEAVMAGKTEFQTEFSKVLADRKKLVDALVTQGQHQQKLLTQKVTEQSTIANYANQTSMVLVNLDDTKSKSLSYMQKLLSLDLRAYSVRTSGDPFWTSRQRLAYFIKKAEPLSKEDFFKSISSQKLSAETAKKLCVYYMTELLAPALTKRGLDEVPLLCANRSQAAAESLLIREKIYHVNKFDHFSYLTGRYENISLSNSFSLSNTFTDSRSHTMSTSIGAKSPDFLIFSAGAQTSMAWTKQTAQSSSNTINISHALPLRYQMSQTRFDMRDYETCYQLRMNPNLFIKEVGVFEKFNFTKTNFFSFLDHKKPVQDIFNILNRGILVCERPKEMKPLRKFENFYVVQQEPMEGELQDKGNAKNRFLFLTIRGDQQFRRFVSMAKSEYHMPGGTRLIDANVDVANRSLMNSFNFKPWSPRIYVEPQIKN